jgi:NitT/TauT family transport system ATP-binding protein
MSSVQTLAGVETGLTALAVSLRGVTKTYDNGVLALGPLDLAVRKGEFISLLGPSGCGKSTALRLIAELSAPSSGIVRLARREGGAQSGHVQPGHIQPGHGIGFVFQEPTLMPWTSARENVRLPLKLAGVPKAEARARADQALASVGLGDFADAFPRELSGGMKMRVSLARALVTDPDVLLMDEPFAALDEITRRLGKTVIFVTHSVFESVYLSQRVVVMTARPGRIQADFRIETVEPRGEEFRTSVAYSDYCRKVSAALAPSYAGQSTL